MIQSKYIDWSEGQNGIMNCTEFMAADNFGKIALNIKKTSLK